MSKAKIPQRHHASQSTEPRTVPLAEITITWPRRNDFEGDQQRAPVTVTGTHLAQYLAWLARRFPYRGRLAPGEDVFMPELAHLKLSGVAEILRLLQDERRADGIDLPAVLAMLTDVTNDVIAELQANEDARIHAKDAIATLSPAPAEAAR